MSPGGKPFPDSRRLFSSPEPGTISRHSISFWSAVLCPASISATRRSASSARVGFVFVYRDFRHKKFAHPMLGGRERELGVRHVVTPVSPPLSGAICQLRRQAGAGS